MKEQELLSICNPINTFSGNAPWIYWPPEMYSHGKYIREYAFYPKRLPLIIYSDHGSGINGSDLPSKHELETNAPVFFTYSKVKALNYHRLTGKKSYVMLSPAIYYRKKYNIVRDVHSVGTLAFPAHSTPSIDDISNLDQYAKQLKNLPAKYQPVTVCLHMHDINKGLYKIFMSNGIPVTTAGNTSDYRFLERLYGLIRMHSFVTSNMVGSYMSLAIEMDIPFFIYGEPQKYINKDDLNLPLGEYDPYKDYPLFKELHEKLIYDRFDGTVDLSIKNLIESKLGVNDTISRIHMAVILWFSFFSWITSINFLKWMKSQLKEYLLNRLVKD